MRSRKRALALASSALIATAAFVATSPAAHAVPTECYATQNGNIAESYCANGTGEHQVAVTVLHVNPMVGYVANWGPWVPAGSVSRATIPPGTVVSLRFHVR
ncbi:hypothetical protein [Nonomuraea longicatena]|uniref:Uncharacterized protein n=1 Tax=Nonomuraea longicatena TaxID=83682 RepID=A0ABP4BRR4_9ACTN